MKLAAFHDQAVNFFGIMQISLRLLPVKKTATELGFQKSGDCIFTCSLVESKPQAASIS